MKKFMISKNVIKNIRMFAKKIKLIFFICIIGMVQMGYADNTEDASKNTVVKKASFDLSTQGLLFSQGAFSTGISVDFSCAYVNDQGVYASFGQETQMRCLKFVATITPAYILNVGVLSGRIDVAPIYKAIKYKQPLSKPFIYAKDSHNRPISSNVYVDWYKNLNTQIYDTEDAPLINTYLQYEVQKYGTHTFRFGRMVDIVGMEETQFFWGDNGKFSPYSYYISKQLLSGVMYGYNISYFFASMGAYFGGNPAVDGLLVCNNLSPSEKNNHTPILEGKIGGKLPISIAHGIYIRAFVSGKHNADGSVYDVRQCGKTMNNIAVGNLQAHWDIFPFLQATALTQTTYWTSGLTTQSSQNDGSAKFHDFAQQAWTYGLWMKWVHYIHIGVSYEQFPRMDGQVYKALNYKGRSFGNVQDWIFHARFYILPVLSVYTNMMMLKNPASFASNVLDTRGENRYEVGIAFQTLGFS